jgi:hypothetical protein
MTNRAQILITCTNGFKSNAEIYAQKQGISLSQLVRECVAKQIDYDLSQETKTDGRRKYASEEDRKQANNAKQKEKRQNVTKLLALLQHEEHLEGVEAIEAYLKRKGILD